MRKNVHRDTKIFLPAKTPSEATYQQPTTLIPAISHSDEVLWASGNFMAFVRAMRNEDSVTWGSWGIQLYGKLGPKGRTASRCAMYSAVRGRDVASVLDDNGAQTEIEAIIWSHSHFDHVWDPSRFPPSTTLVVGPRVPATAPPGYPSDPNCTVLDSDAVVREINFAGGGPGGRPPRIGRLEAFDYFGDGSFYLLDAPGHASGHMCGLARTTADPPTFAVMGPMPVITPV